MSEVASMIKHENDKRTIYRCSVCNEIVGYISKQRTSVGLCEHLTYSIKVFEESDE